MMVSRCCSISNRLPHELHGLDAVISKETNHGQRAQKNDRCIAAHKSGVKMTNESSSLSHRVANRMQKAINHANVKKFPESFARADLIVLMIVLCNFVTVYLFSSMRGNCRAVASYTINHQLRFRIRNNSTDRHKRTLVFPQ